MGKAETQNVSLPHPPVTAENPEGSLSCKGLPRRVMGIHAGLTSPKHQSWEE